jgi:hypothetical protein
MLQDLADLDGFSRKFAETLFAVYPAWREFARKETNKAGDRYLVVQPPDPPGSSTAEPLTIWTENGEVSVGFDHFHMHFYWPAEEDLDPLKFIEDVLADRVAVVSYWKGDQWLGSSTLGLEETPDVEPGILVRVRSWSGARDQNSYTG